MDESVYGKLIERIAELEGAIADQQRRMNNMFREGVVGDVDYSKGAAVVDADGIETDQISWLERAGDIRDWNPPKKGERVVVISPNGDIDRAFIMNGGYSQDFPSPHNQGGQSRKTIGNVQLTQSGSSLVIEAGGVTVTVSGAGLQVTGGQVTHNGKDIGDTHKHTDTEPGGGVSGVPQ